LKGAKEAMREANDILGDAKKETLSCKCYEESRTGRAEEQVRRAEGRLKQLEEENLSQKLSNKKETLDRFINGNRLRDNRNEVKNLRNAYERLFRIQENDDIRNLRNNIETIRDNLLDAGIEFDDLERIRELCEEISKLQIQSEQEFVAQIQVPLHQFRFN
jgi:predicted RNase H-like nuclease (RuvC/YqgF family)